MDKLVKFFKEKNADRKFAKLGEGHRLGDASVQHSASTANAKRQSTSCQSTPPSSRSVEATLSRIAITESRGTSNQTVSSTQNERNLQHKSVEVENAKEIHAEKPIFIPKLLFWCPNLFGDTVVGSRDEIEQAIQNYLLSGSVCNTNEAIVLMVIRGIEKSKLPSSSNIPLSELPSLSEIKQNRKQNIVRILQNLISAPENPVYRRLRASNKLIQDLLSIDGFESFLTLCNFKKMMLPATRPSGQQQVEGDDEKPTVGNNEDAVEEYKEAFYVISEEDANKREHLEKLLNLFTTADPILPELYRNTKVYRATGRTLTCIPRDHLPDEFFSLTKEEFRKCYDHQHRIIEEGRMLLTKAMRERLKTQHMKSFRYAVIRVRFPDNLLLQGTFYAMDKLSTVRQWISECLAKPYLFRLYAPPSIQTATLTNAPPTVPVELTDDNLSLSEVGLAPSSLINLTFIDRIQQEASGTSVLRFDLNQSVEDI
ncbi:unnamed protein product [Schistosoma guineensis]|nr:unnamed protein product [Schistosoma guineensis]